MRLPKSFRIIQRAFTQFHEHNGSLLGTALAYYALFSIAPLLVIAISITGVLFGEDTATDSAIQSLEAVMDPTAAQTVMNAIEHTRKPMAGTWGIVISSALLLYGALRVFFHLRTSLCKVWDLPPPSGNSFLGMLLSYALAVAMVLIISFLLLTSVVVTTMLNVALAFLKEKIPLLQDNFRYIEMCGSYLSVSVLFMLTYRILSGRTIPWRYVIYGSLVTAFFFSVGKTLFSCPLPDSDHIFLWRLPNCHPISIC